MVILISGRSILLPKSYGDSIKEFNLLVLFIVKLKKKNILYKIQNLSSKCHFSNWSTSYIY